MGFAFASQLIVARGPNNAAAGVRDVEPPRNDANLAKEHMLNTTTHTVTHGADSDAISLVFYPDTGCLRFADALGFFHELRPPHSWIAISSASRGVCRGTHAMTDVLNTLLREFCAVRPRWSNGPARVSVAAPVGAPAVFQAPVHTVAHASDDAAARTPHRALPVPFGAGLQA